jgi:dTDP-4-amino-4,6-dideoxygalactose transaminase
MSVFREIPPTAGFPIDFKDLPSAFKSGLSKNCLAYDFQNYLGVAYAKIASSGTAGLYLILETLKDLTPKRTVVIPSFVCPLVAIAAHKAGFKIEVCDIYKDDFGFYQASLRQICSKNSDIAAIVAVHLAGMPTDMDAIAGLNRKEGIFIIEDCAQALGAEYNRKKVGTLGDFAFFSLCRGKGMTIYEGGAVTTDNQEYARLIEAKSRKVFKTSVLSESLKILELFGYSIVYRPELFWFCYQLPRIFWKLSGKNLKVYGEDFDEDFPTYRVSSIRQKIGHSGFGYLDGEINKQRAKANYYIDKLKGLEGIRVIREPRDSRSTYPYLTLLFGDKDKRNAVLDAFEGMGLGVSQIYAFPLTDYPYLKSVLPQKDFPNARYMAEHSLTLSTSTFITEEEMRLICEDIINITQ